MTWSNGFHSERGKKSALVRKEEARYPLAEKYYYNEILMKFLEGREDEDKRQQKNVHI